MVESVLEEQVECTGGQNGHYKWRRDGINFTLEQGILQDASRASKRRHKDNQRQRYK
jgi:hypothetical protein